MIRDMGLVTLDYTFWIIDRVLWDYGCRKRIIGSGIWCQEYGIKDMGKGYWILCKNSG